jgi:hypothetical protein
MVLLIMVRGLWVPIGRKSQSFSSRDRDESRLYNDMLDYAQEQKTVQHSADEYVRYENGENIHVNSAEGYFSVCKRGMKGIYQHCGERHLHNTLRNLIFGTITALGLALTISNAPTAR